MKLHQYHRANIIENSMLVTHSSILLNLIMAFYRFESGDAGIYETVEKDCPRDKDPRRTWKFDGSWLPKVGKKFPGAISFFTEKGLKRYITSGLQFWHSQVVKKQPQVYIKENFRDVLYVDDYQIIVEPEIKKKCESVNLINFMTRYEHKVKKHKVLAYITNPDASEVLCFIQTNPLTDFLQVPKGNIKPGEELEISAKREVMEETGITLFSSIKNLGSQNIYHPWSQSYQKRHYFHFVVPEIKAKTFDHTVTGGGGDDGFIFSYQWLPRKMAVKEIVGQAEFIAKI